MAKQMKGSKLVGTPSPQIRPKVASKAPGPKLHTQLPAARPMAVKKLPTRY